MTATLLVASRKGLITVEGGDGHWHCHAPHFAGDAVSQVLADPRDGAWYAALRLGHFGVKLRKSTDRGANWTEITAPAFPAKPTEGPWADDPTPWSVDLIWALAAGGAKEPGTLWAGCLPAGLFRSTDGGTSWQLMQSLWEDERRREWFGGGYDHAGIHSVLVDPRDPRHVTLGISCGGVWQTRDAGATWTVTSEGLRADFMPEERAFDPNIQDPHGVAQCTAQPDHLWLQHHCGLYRSTDGGQHWLPIPSPAPSGFGFAVVADPQHPERAWFVPAQADACRFPVDGRLVVNRTDDGGQTFTSFGEGLPQANAYDLVYRHALVVTPDGRTLAMASTTGSLWISEDAGERWQLVNAHLPPVAALAWAA